MFGTNTTLPSNRMLSFDSALRIYNSIKPIRGRSDQNTRPLARRGSDILTIRQDPNNGDIVVRLYSTDIIRYYAQGDGCNNPIELGPYPSATTNRVVWSLLGPHVNTFWSNRSHALPNHITEVNGRYYNTPEYALIQPDERGWHVIGGAKPFEVPRLNRKEGSLAIKEYGVKEFETWLRTLIRLDQDPRSSRYQSRSYDWSTREIRELLSVGPKRWGEVAERMSQYRPLKSEFEALRRAVYNAEMCYETETVPYFEGYQALHNALNRMRRAD